jgi:acyl-CoA synthetase (AMP-forming)/AMP-acid ligase II
MNIRSVLEEKVRTRENDVFLVFHDDIYTYGEFNAAVNRVANSLSRLGISKGDRVGGFMPNCLEWLVLYFAIAKLGAASVFVNTQYDSELLEHSLNASRVKAVLVSSSLFATYEKIRGNLKKVGPEILINDKENKSIQKGSHTIPYKDLLSGSSDLPADPGIPGGTPLAFFYTSGTSGLPKPCVTSHNYILALAARVARILKATPDDRVLSCLPNYHVNVYIGIFTALMAGSVAVVEERFSASNYWNWVRKHEATILTLHIAPVNILLNQSPRPDDADNPARAGILLVGESATPFVNRFGLSTGLVVYGSTEAGGFSTMGTFGPGSKHDPKWTGCPRDDVEVKILDENDEEVPPGTLGEIVIRDKVPHTIFSGYFNLPEKTAQACRNFWYHSGDSGYIDKEGSLYFLGRTEESIRVKGDFIPVDKLEACIRSNPKIRECAAIGVPSDIGEEDIMVYIQLKENVSSTPEEIITYCEDRLPKFAVPRYIGFVEEFPTAALYKVQKAKLKERGIVGAWDRLAVKSKS